MTARLEGVWVWVVVAAAAAAGAVVFAMRGDWLPLILLVVAVAIAGVQLGRIFMRTRSGGKGGRRY